MKQSNSSDFIFWAAAAATIGSACLSIGFVLGNLWLSLSFGASALKAFTKGCDRTYTIEKYVSGDWFCEAKTPYTR